MSRRFPALLMLVLMMPYSGWPEMLGHGKYVRDDSAVVERNRTKSVPQAEDFTLFESGQVRPLLMSADGTTLYALNTPDNRLEILAINEVGLIHRHSVPVGLEPVALALTADGGQAWVVNHLSDSVSIVDLSASPPRVINTLWVGDEPRDIIMAGIGDSRAFITTAHRGQNSPVDFAPETPGIGRADVWVFDTANTGEAVGGTPLTILSLFGDTPRALARSTDGRTVYAAVFRSGNQTMTLDTQLTGTIFNKAAPTTSADGVTQPDSGIIVKFNGVLWLDELNQVYNEFITVSLPDEDVFEIDAAAAVPVMTRSHAHVGTTLFNMAVNPVSGALYVSNTDARNHVRFAGQATRANSTVQGHMVDNRITVIRDGQVSPRQLNNHLDFSNLRPDEGSKRLSISTPLQLVVSSDGERLYQTSFGSSTVAVFDTAALEDNTHQRRSEDLITLSAGGPSGLVLDEARQRLYVLTRFDNGISTVDLSSNSEIDHIQLFNPEPDFIRTGRPFLYDAQLTSGNGNDSCASCHLFGDNDALAWDLGDPDGVMKEIPNPHNPLTAGIPSLNSQFHPMKGPMTTQSMRGLKNHGPMHWRGDRTGQDRLPGQTLEHAAFMEFNEAFVALMGRDEELSEEDMTRFTDFSLALRYPPNPNRQLNNQLTEVETQGKALYDFGIIRGDNGNREICVTCHVIDPANGLFGTDGQMGFNSQIGETNFKIPHFRDMYQKVGSFLPSHTRPFLSGPQVRGFGFNHNGAHSSINMSDFASPTDQITALRSFLHSFPSESAPILGQQLTLTADNLTAASQRLELLVAQAQVTEPLPECDLTARAVVNGEATGWFMTDSGEFASTDETSNLSSLDDLKAIAASGSAVTLTCAPWGGGKRIGFDRDLDGVSDLVENRQGSDSASAASSSFNPWAGLWFDPSRNGHGIDLQRVDSSMVITWYTYESDGQPVWYQAVAALDTSISGDLVRYTRNPDNGELSGEIIGTVSLAFNDKRTARFDWQIGEDSGSEQFQRFVFSGQLTTRKVTGIWYDPDEPGYGVTLDSQGQTLAAVAYFYDGDNQPRWVLGQSDNLDTTSVDMLRFTGFCPGCEFSEVEFAEGGSLTLDFDGLRDSVLDLDVNPSGEEADRWQRSDTAIIPLSNEANDL